MTGKSDKEHQDIIHLAAITGKLTKEKNALILSLQEANNEIGRLKVEILQLEKGHVLLTLKLEDATKEISVLTVKLEDSNNEVGRLGMVLRHQADNARSLQKK